MSPVLTFLFTDVAESTRLWERFPEAMGVALGRHDAILRGAVEDFGGSVVKTTGDGLMAVFESAAEAVAAAVTGQTALASEDWGAQGQLRVRMGIHAGEAEARAGDFYGTAVNRAARIMAAAHGGQVLVSAAIAGVVADRLPIGARLIALGEHRLRDLSEPERLYQLSVEGLPDDFPLPLTLTGRPNNLPIQTSEFLGRRTELQAIRETVTTGARLVTLTGPGGTGKTRLGLQTAASLIDDFPDGVYLVDLSNESGRQSVLEAIQRALGAPAGEQGTMASLVSHLRDRRLLLLVDNFEHVTEAAPDLADLLATVADVHILVTSREALRVRGERLFPVQPMGLPAAAAPSVESVAAAEAVRLFVERARAVRPEFSLTESNAAAVAEICTRLDGLPLAIELAAARLTLFSPEELLDRLRDRLDVLGSGARDLPARQRTIRSTIEWSVDLLDEDELTVFMLLAVFASARVESIEDVARRVVELSGLDVLGGLGSLVDKSLVRSTPDRGRQRLSMLRTIREHAAERLDARPDLAPALRTAHAEHYSDLAAMLCETVFGPERADTLDEIDGEIGNLLLSWGHWKEVGDSRRLRGLLDCLWPFHDARGSYAATIGPTTDLLELVSSAEPSPEQRREEVALRTSLARALIATHGATRQVEEAVTRAMDLFAEEGAGAERFAVLRNLATLFGGRGDFARARDFGLELLGIAEEADDEALRCEAHFVVGAYTAFTGDIDDGLKHLERATQLFDAARPSTVGFRVGPISGVMAFMVRALLLWWRGRLVSAVASRDRALEMARLVGHPYTLAYVLYHVAFFDLVRRDLDGIAHTAAELRRVAQANDYEVWLALAMLLEGVVGAGSDDPEPGLKLIDEAMAAYEVLDTPPVFWAFLQTTRAIAFGMAGRPGPGLGCIEEAIGVTEPGTPDFALASTVKGELLWAAGDLDGADSALTSAIETASQARVPMVELGAATRLTALRRSQGRSPDGSELVRSALDRIEEGFELPAIMEARDLAAR